MKSSMGIKNWRHAALIERRSRGKKKRREGRGERREKRDAGDKMRFSTDLGDCRLRSPSSSWPYLACRDFASSRTPAFLGSAETKISKIESASTFLVFRWSMEQLFHDT
jgi:hypothetical protein